MIVEIAGRPSEHVREALKTHVEKLKSYKGVRIDSMSLSTPREIEKFGKDGKPTGELTGNYTCFSEIDFEAESFSIVSDVVFDFMPSSIEVIEPSKFSVGCVEATSILNNVSGRIHRYDEVARLAQFKIHQLSNQLGAIQGQKIMDENLSKKISKSKKVSKKK